MEIVDTAREFTLGVLKRAYWFIPALLSRPLDVLALVSGEKFSIPSSWLPLLLGLCFYMAAVQTYYDLRQRKLATDQKLAVETKDHDVTIFKKLDAIASESNIDDLVRGRIYTRTLRVGETNMLADLIDAQGRAENRYLDEVLQEHAKALVHELEQLLAIVGQTFWSVKGTDRLKFRPDPIDPEVYNSEWTELCQRIDRTLNAYKTYRATVKDRLRV